MSPTMRRRAIRGWLALFALTVIVGMQAGTIFKPLGDVGDTRAADWADLLTPFALLGTAAVVLVRAGATRGQWVLFGVGGVAFTLGHGLHLAANSISNVADDAVADAAIVHLWDEVVSHWIWYTGLFLVFSALAWALRGVEFRLGLLGGILALLVALTLANTYIEGATPWLGMAFLLCGVLAGLAWRGSSVARLLLLISCVGLALLVGWGAYWYLADGSVFPEFSELGWI